VSVVAVRGLVLPLAEFTLEVTLESDARATALYGPSGAGKTSLLECIAGLRTPTSGTIAINGRDVTRVAPRHRRVGYVPQDDALFPHLSVRGNIFYGTRGGDGAAVLDVLELRSLLERNVRQLSGGERKRVALARALLSEPELLLLDEPLAGVDLELRARVLDYMLRVRDEFQIPTIYVSHQWEEVTAICEAVAVLERGRLLRFDRL
jgi:molybdate transport system ATP-binding protein